MANWPSVNPAELDKAKPEDLTNQATSLNYEPGSTFKAFTVAAALEEGLVTPSTEFTIPPQIEIGERIIKDAEEHGTENMTVAQILARSSNIGAVEIGQKIGATNYSKWIERFGFGKQTGVQFPGEEKGIVPKLDEYSGATMGNLPMGQGAAVTPMQMVQGYTAIAHDGVERPPQLIKRIGEKAVREPKGHRVISAQTAASCAKCSRECSARKGPPPRSKSPATRWRARPAPPRLPKTAATRKPNTSPPSSASRRRKDPKFLAAVIVDQPEGEIYGGSVAAPAFGEIAEFSLPYLGVPQE